MPIVVGVDAGGTRTVAAVDRGDDVPSTHVGPGANPNVYGMLIAADTIATMIAGALNGDAPDAIAIGAAGAGFAGTGDALQRELQSRFPAAGVTVTHDLRIALRGAIPHGDGAVLVAGTGSAAYAEIGEESVLFGGGGFAYGDEGSGYTIGAAALRLLRRCFEGRARDALADALIAQTGARNAAELNAYVYGAVSPVAAVAAVAATVIACADAGDRSALKIIQAAALDLFDLARAVCRSHGTESAPFPLAFSGGLLSRNSILTYLIETRIGNELPHVAVVKNGGEPYLGALALARSLLRGIASSPSTPRAAHAPLSPGSAPPGVTSSGAPPSVTSSGAPPSVTSSGAKRSRDGGRPLMDDLPATERVAPHTAGLDRMPTMTLIETLVADQGGAFDAVASQVESIGRVVDEVTARIASGGRLHYVGAGSSGRLATLDAAEMPPTFGTLPELVCAHIAGGSDALARSVEGAEDDRAAGAAEMKAHVRETDAVIGISASGAAPYVASALESARKIGAFTVAIVNADRSPLETIAETTIVLSTGAEAIAGSTRMKAGTAQKIALNAISTGIMVRLGKVHDNLMVDLVATNQKLRRRAVRLVCLLAGVEETRARELLAQAGGSVKLAVVMERRGVEANEAEALLQQNAGMLRSLL